MSKKFVFLTLNLFPKSQFGHWSTPLTMIHVNYVVAREINSTYMYELKQQQHTHTHMHSTQTVHKHIKR